MKISIIIPVYGKQHLTHQLLADIAQYGDEQCQTLIVDNGGDYKTYAHESVIRPGSNLGWLKGTNLGLQTTKENSSDTLYMCINNDTRLSPGFLFGIREAFTERPLIGLLAPLYDAYWPQQKSTYSGPAAEFKPEPRELRTHFVDGTCMIIPQRTLDAVGYLDEEHFGQYGWGADQDYCYRVRRAGGSVMVTYRAYINHFQKGSVSDSNYNERSQQEMLEGMNKKYGEHWREFIYKPS